MNETGNPGWGSLQSRISRMAWQFVHVRSLAYPPSGAWIPPSNVYGCPGGFVICVDLAGVDQGSISLMAEPRRLILKGERAAPEPGPETGSVLQILAMEIDHGPFLREFTFPAEVDPGRIEAEQRKGILWIRVPLRETT